MNLVCGALDVDVSHRDSARGERVVRDLRSFMHTSRLSRHDHEFAGAWKLSTNLWRRRGERTDERRLACSQEHTYIESASQVASRTIAKVATTLARSYRRSARRQTRRSASQRPHTAVRAASTCTGGILSSSCPLRMIGWIPLHEDAPWPSQPPGAASLRSAPPPLAMPTAPAQSSLLPTHGLLLAV